jgi:pimeloyl-ACP methyl ester carboxylesterase
MKLEVITRAPTGKPCPTPLLFVHGSYSGAWVWDRHFLPFFAAQGYEAQALSLRGHGASAGREILPFCRLRDYVADLEQVASALPRPPVLIGHSMGGMVVQKVLHRQRFPAAVLMASVPPHGLLGSLLGMALTNPVLDREIAWAQALEPRSVAVRGALFSDDTPDDEVLGAENDGFVFSGALEATARTYRTRPEILPGLAHAMMLDHGWETMARRILDWLAVTLGDETGW